MSGNTEPSILNGLLGNVEFVPWKGFVNVVSDGLHILNGFTSEELFEVEASLHKARRFIQESRKDHLICLELQKKRKAEHDLKAASKLTKQKRSPRFAHRLDDLAISNGNEGDTVSGADRNEQYECDIIAIDNRKHEDESSSSEDEAADWRMELPVNTSSSILDLHKDIFDALKELLRLMYPHELLRMDLKTISSENLFNEKRGKMLYDYMHKIVEHHQRLQNSEDWPDAKCACTEEVKDLPQKKVCTENKPGGPPAMFHHQKEGAGVMNPQEYREENGTVPRRSARIEEKLIVQKKQDQDPQSLTVPVRPVVRLSQTPDRALFRIAENDRGAVPVCCYEYKAPALDLSGLHTPGSSKKTTRNGRFASALDESRAEEESEDFMYMTGLSAKIISNEYNRLFRNPLHMDKKRPEFADARAVLLPIAQAICQALLSKTGCVFLTNHQMSFALRVEENKERFGARVFVTGAIPSNRVPGQFAAMLGFSKYCMDRVRNEEERNMLDPQRRLLTSLSYKAYHADISDEQLDPDWCPMGPPDDGCSTDSKPVTRHARSCATRDSMVDESGILLDNYNEKVLLDRTNAFARPELITLQRMSRSSIDERFKKMFATTEEVLGVGATGVLVRGVWEGKKVAIKMWNGHSRDGFLSIRREIRIYDRLREKCPYLLGCAVPGYFLGWDRRQELSVYRKELILVLEHVGDRIWRDRDGIFWIDRGRNYEMLKTENVQTICGAALSSLAKLHTQGFLHGDIALRNVRVSRTESGSGWKVWWVDLGRAFEFKDGEESSCFKLEKKKCLSIFTGMKHMDLKSLGRDLLSSDHRTTPNSCPTSNSYFYQAS